MPSRPNAAGRSNCATSARRSRARAAPATIAARSERVLSRGHDTLSVYGIGKQRSIDEWRNVARALLHQGLIEETQDGYPVLSLNAQSRLVLRGELTVHIAAPAKPKRARPSGSALAGTGTGMGTGNGTAPNGSGASAPEGSALF